MRIGLIREGKVPIDRRVPFTPDQCRRICQTWPETALLVQKSEIRCFADEAYAAAGFEPVEDVSGCEVLFGIKEVPIGDLIPGRTYFYFSHTIKKQPYNRDLLRAMLERKIRMVDYEAITDAGGNRLVAFGRFAGIVGAYNGILAYGRRYGLFDLKPAHRCEDMKEMWREFERVSLPPVKVAVTGGGRVANGAIEVLEGMGIGRVEPGAYLEEAFTGPVYAQLRSSHFNAAADGRAFVPSEFYENPGAFRSTFDRFTRVTDILVAGAYWHPEAPVLFTREDAQRDDFKVRVIADVTCDIQGSIPSTLRPSTIPEPLYDYNPFTGREEPPCSSERNITVMAVDNLPCEVPVDASEAFGLQLIENVLPALFGVDEEGRIERAVVCEAGRLTDRYAYLQDYVDGKE